MATKFLEQILLPVEILQNAQKIKFSVKDFFIECEQIRGTLLIWSHLLKKSLTVS